MRKTILLAIAMFVTAHLSYAFDGKDTAFQKQLALITFMDSVNQAMKYDTGTVLLSNETAHGFATLKIPAGFKYLNAKQSNYVLSEIWGNPAQTGVMGMLFPATGAPYADSSYAYVITYEEAGYVKDEDADKINYNDMLKEMQKDEAETNKERLKGGYETIHMVGWAQPPFYDKNRKVLHWAKELQFGGESGENTLNYDIRVLGRRGVLSLNAVASMSGLPLVKADINKVLAIPEFTAGNKYSDFVSGTDNVAAYTIGGLVAGKLLMKVGFWALILKFWKLVVAGVLAAYYGVKKFITRRRKNEEETIADIGGEPEPIV